MYLNAYLKKKLIFLLPLLLIIIPSVSALTITNTTFFASDNNFTILVDSIILDQVTVSNSSIEFFNLTSIGSNFTNTNATFDARADFLGLDIGLVVRNVNTATDLFTSTSGSQNFNATFTSGQVITINGGATPSTGRSACDVMVQQFGTFPILIGLLGTIILLGAVIFVLTTGFVSINFDFNKGLVFGGILAVVSVAILIIIAIVIFGNLCILL